MLVCFESKKPYSLWTTCLWTLCGPKYSGKPAARLAGPITPSWQTTFCILCFNRRFPEITGEDNLTAFSYSGRVKSPEWKWQRRRADLRHFEIFRHGPIIIYTRLPAGGAYYPICTFPASSECLIGISDAFSLRVSVILPMCSLYPQQKRTFSALHPVHARRLLSSAVPWISEDCLFKQKNCAHFVGEFMALSFVCEWPSGFFWNSLDRIYKKIFGKCCIYMYPGKYIGKILHVHVMYIDLNCYFECCNSS